MAQKMKEESNPDLKINLEEDTVLSAITKDGEYKTDGVKIKKWEKSEGKDAYIIEMAKSNLKFVGVLNKKFQRDGYGYHEFGNGEKYCGYFKENQRYYNGIYFWPSEVKNGRLNSEIYYGYWRDNHKDSNGIYIWLDEPNNEDDRNFDNTNLEAYAGQIVNGTYSFGTYLQKTGDDYYLYYGNFTSEGLKNDENGFFYSSKFDRLFHGKIENDVFEEGFVFVFDSDSGHIDSIGYSYFDKDMNVTNFISESELDEGDKETESKLCSRFRDVILGIDYFGELYQKIKDFSFLIDGNMGDISIFNDEEKYSQITKMSSGYSRNNIDKDIGGKVFEE
jgi:hypothetical protein